MRRAPRVISRSLFSASCGHKQDPIGMGDGEGGAADRDDSGDGWVHPLPISP